MLTPQEITSKEFVKAVFGGYDMSAVDDFIEAVTADYSVLYKENAILKSKIKVLVEKVEEYRSTEDAMRMALLTAQKMGDDLMTEAKAKSEQLMAEAAADRAEKLKEVDKLIEEENYKLQAAKAKTAEYVKAARLLLEEHDNFLTKVDEISAPEEPAPAQPEPTREERILDAARTINDAVAKITQDTAPQADNEADVDALVDEISAVITPDEPEYDDESEPTKIFSWEDGDTSPRPKFDFNDLKFGTNYHE